MSFQTLISLLLPTSLRATPRIDPSAVNPRGPVFIPYRQSDGFILAEDVAWALRAAGVPVWHDKSDLFPGDTNLRLEEALSSGLSGAALLTTPEIGLSGPVRVFELPRLGEGAFRHVNPQLNRNERVKTALFRKRRPLRGLPCTVPQDRNRTGGICGRVPVGPAVWSMSAGESSEVTLRFSSVTDPFNRLHKICDDA